MHTAFLQAQDQHPFQQKFTFFVSQDKVCYQVTTGILGKTKTAMPAFVLPWKEQAAALHFLPF